ncbi:MAG: EAL domain-containing protein [Clostridiales bacterium]|nr:EAL domain-containing protein [Clostridiales bacterium]
MERKEKTILNTVKEALGFSRYTPYLSNAFLKANMKACIYMSLVILSLEAWMMFMVYKIYLDTKDTNPKHNLAWLVEKEKLYVMLFASALLVLIYAIHFLKSKKKHGILVGNILVFAFATICVVFGMHISWPEYNGGYQILCFVTMVIFAMCLLVWRPWFSFLCISFAFWVFFWFLKYMSPEASAAGLMNESMWINYLTLYISVCIVSLSAYQQRLSEAKSLEDLAKKNENLKYIAVHDEITGIGNLSWFMETANRRADEKPDERRCYLFIDLENFKSYNEYYNFETGNELLKKTAQKLKEIFKGEPVARFSDDHFIVLTSNYALKEPLKEFGAFLEEVSKDIKVGFKCGAYAISGKKGNPSLALDHARYACQTIKKKYGEHFCEYNESMSSDFYRQQYIVNHIDEALEKGWIKVFYQPVMWSDSLTMCGFEALARWQDPKYGSISPGVFVPVLEEYRLIQKLDMGITRIVFEDMREALEKGNPVIPCSINFSRIDFEMLDVLGLLEELYQQYGLSKKFIHVEVTESALTDKEGMLRDAIAELNNNGFPLWLDDFGSGYSSFNVLKDFDFSVIKVDMMFLKGFDKNPKNKIILNSIFEMARNLGVDTLCEGVETEEQCEFLKEAGCRRLQGFYFSKPVPKEEIIARIRNGSLKVADKMDYA